MKRRGLLLIAFSALLVFLSGCNTLTVLDPKGPVAKTQADVIIFSIITMAFILLVVYVLFVYMLTKYRASKAAPDYEPPHDEGKTWLEIVWTAFPLIIVIILSVVTIRSTNEVEAVPKDYQDQKPMIIYAASSNWKWHFSYPEEGIETVNYVNIPTYRPVEFRLYAYGPITSFWVPQLGGQKYAMSDMVTKLNFVAEHEGSFLGKNANFSGEGFAHMQFEVLAMNQKEYDKWVEDVKNTASDLTPDEFQTLLDTKFVGRKTYTSTHLTFLPPPEGEHAGHNHGDAASKSELDQFQMDQFGSENSGDGEMDHSGHNH